MRGVISVLLSIGVRSLELLRDGIRALVYPAGHSLVSQEANHRVSSSLIARENGDGRNADRRLANRCVHATSQGDHAQKSASGVILAHSCKSLATKIAASDRGSLRGLTQFPRVTSLASVEPA